jgi:hypothetical protein
MPVTIIVGRGLIAPKGLHDQKALPNGAAYRFRRRAVLTDPRGIGGEFPCGRAVLIRSSTRDRVAQIPLVYLSSQPRLSPDNPEPIAFPPASFSGLILGSFFRRSGSRISLARLAKDSSPLCCRAGFYCRGKGAARQHVAGTVTSRAGIRSLPQSEWSEDRMSRPPTRSGCRSAGTKRRS